jgi:gas vesicle protein
VRIKIADLYYGLTIDQSKLDRDIKLATQNLKKGINSAAKIIGGMTAAFAGVGAALLKVTSKSMESTKMNSVMVERWNNSLNRLRDSWENIEIIISSKLAPLFTNLFDKISDWIEQNPKQIKDWADTLAANVKKVVDKFEELWLKIGGVEGALKLLKATAITVATIIGVQLFAAVSKIITATYVLAAVLAKETASVLTNTAAWISNTAAKKANLVWVVKTGPAGKFRWGDGTWVKKPTFEKAADAGFIAYLVKITTQFKSLWAFISKTALSIWKLLSGIVATIVKVISIAIKGIVAAVSSIYGIIAAVALAIYGIATLISKRFAEWQGKLKFFQWLTGASKGKGDFSTVEGRKKGLGDAVYQVDTTGMTREEREASYSEFQQRKAEIKGKKAKAKWIEEHHKYLDKLRQLIIDQAEWEKKIAKEVAENKIKWYEKEIEWKKQAMDELSDRLKKVGKYQSY